MMELELSVKRDTWRMEDPHAKAADVKFKAVRDRILRGQKFTCCFCGFRCEKSANYMEIHHYDDDHTNNEESNLVTACKHCHAVFHFGLWTAKSKAVLIYLPEMPQATLSHLQRTMMVVKSYLDENKGKAPDVKSLYDSIKSKLREREVMLQERIKTKNASVIANVFREVDDETYAARSVFFKPIRLLLPDEIPVNFDHPNQSISSDLTKVWTTSGPYAGMSPKEWGSFVNSLGSGLRKFF